MYFCYTMGPNLQVSGKTRAGAPDIARLGFVSERIIDTTPNV